MDLEKKVLEFTLDLYGNSNFSRNDVQFVIHLVEQFIKDSYNPFLLSKLSENLFEAVSTEVSQEINKTFRKHQDPFLDFNSEDKRLRRYTKLNLYTEPQLSPVANVCKPIPCGNNKLRILEYQVEIAYIPIKNSLSQMLHIDGLLDAMLEYKKNLENEKTLSNFVQGSLWKKQVSLWNEQVSHANENSIVFPFFGHVDDVETGNALGSRAGFNEVGALYGTTPCFPPSFASKLESIILCQIFYTHDRKKYGNELIFSKFVDEMNDLRENGIEIVVNNKRFTVYFILSLMLGDNLGLNGICGFIESFSATHFCRFCYASADETRCMTSENELLLRTVEKYEQDILDIDAQKTGIKEKCIFNEVKGYHVLENSAVDVMHDLFEGICHYVMSAILLQFILADKFFSIEYLNYRLRTMEFSFESSNVPPQINLDYVKKNHKLKMSATEILFFTRFFGAIIGDKIPRWNKHWHLYIKLREIVHLLTSPVVKKSNLLKLKMLIPEHHQSYIDMFDDLKAKFHILLHYIRVILQNGPVIKFSSMRFESKHQIIKKIVSQSASHVNILKTICIRYLLSLMEIHRKQYKEKYIVHGKNIINSAIHYIFPLSKSVKEVSNVNVNNFNYKKDVIIVTNIDDGVIEFGRIQRIFIVDTKILFDYTPYNAIGFDRHVFGYSVFEIHELRRIDYDDLPTITPCLYFKSMNSEYVITRYVL